MEFQFLPKLSECLVIHEKVIGSVVVLSESRINQNFQISFPYPLQKVVRQLDLVQANLEIFVFVTSNGLLVV